jgi:hypothetical protein
MTSFVNINHKYNTKSFMKYRTSVYAWLQTLARRPEFAALENSSLASDDCQEVLVINF